LTNSINFLSVRALAGREAAVSAVVPPEVLLALWV